MRNKTWVPIVGVVVLILLGLLVIPARDLFRASVAELFLAVIPATLFPILYMAFFPWYRSPLGRALMTKATGLALLIDISVLYAMFGDHYQYREHVRFVVFTLVVCGLWYQMIVIIKIKAQARKRERDGHDAVPMT